MEAGLGLREPRFAGGRMNIDVHVRNCGSIFLLTPLTDPAREWVKEHVQDDATWWGASLVVEHRYVEDILHGMSNEDFTMSYEREA